MTQEEDKINALKNDLMQSCGHEIVKPLEKSGLVCTICGATFVMILLPRLAPSVIPAYEYEDDDC